MLGFGPLVAIQPVRSSVICAGNVTSGLAQQAISVKPQSDFFDWSSGAKGLLHVRNMSLQQQQTCSSEGRAFFIIDNLSAGCLVWTKKALIRLGSTLSVALKQPCPVGVALLQRSKPGQAAAQLQIMLRLGATFKAREYMSCIKGLPSGLADGTASDGNILSSALLALMQHMQKLPARRPDCHNHLFILSSSFAGCVGHPKMQKILQVAATQTSFSLHFLQLVGPEAELQAAATATAPLNQPGLSTADAPDAAFLQLLRGMPACDNVTYDAVVADCEASTDFMCQSWLRELLTPTHSSSNSQTSAPDVVLHFGGQALPCSIQQHILQLDPWLLPAHLCPCHHVPMQPSCTSSSTAAAHAAAAAASDAGSMAALLLLPEASPWSCSISGQPVMSPFSSCPSDARILQLGRHTQLTMPTTAAAGPAASKLTGQAGSVTASEAHKLRMQQALPLAPDQPCQLKVQHVTHPSAVDSMLLYGMPLLLTPTGSIGSSSAGVQHTARAMQNTGLEHVDQGLEQQGQAVAVSATEAGMLMRALCQLLLEQQQVLLASSNHDLLRRIQLPLQQWYMLQPAADGSGLLLRWVASREQLLPPKRREGNALGSTIEGSIAAEGLEDVVLLDAEQVETVRASLASLSGLSGSNGGCIGSKAAGQCGMDSADADATATEGAAAGDAGAVAKQIGTGDVERPQQQCQVQPLLLSCGLDAWVSSVLEASTATYTPPAAAPVVGQPPSVPAAVAAAGPASALSALQGVHGGRAHLTAPTAAQGPGAGVGGAGFSTGPEQQARQQYSNMQAQQQGHWQEAQTGSMGQHCMQHAGGFAPGGLPPPAAGAASGLHNNFHSHQQQAMQASMQQQQQQPGQHDVPQAGAAEAGSAAASGRGGGRNGRGRRNSNTGAASCRKLRLSKV